VHASARKKTVAPSDLHPTVAYRFGNTEPGQAANLGRPGQRPPPRAVSLFFSKSIFFLFAKYLQDSKMNRNISVYSKIVIQISIKSLCFMLAYPTACVIFRAFNIIW
jgi:hypothetical protein